MDDVLDSVRPVHMHGDLHGRVPVLVPFLLRGEDRPSPVAAVSGHEGVFHTLQEVCASGAMQAGTGELDR